jgi:hypothetical protein
MRAAHFSDDAHLESCGRCSQMGSRSKMVHGSELGRSRGWYCGRHALAMGYRGEKLSLWGLS